MGVGREVKEGRSPFWVGGVGSKTIVKKAVR